MPESTFVNGDAMKLSTENTVAQHFETTLLRLLEETFENVQGAFLDKGTSLLQTLASLSSEQASVPVSESGASIAGHVEHTRFYLAVLLDAAHGKLTGTIDWEQSWQVKTVTPEKWTALQAALRETYQQVLTLVKTEGNWEDEEHVGDTMAILAHTAYHLGAIRMALAVVR
ncbi:MAG: hypothetical protein H7145_00755 [Akkermansiaceae bacterium]|nr:hypothetical protein [Armatimonadota bacterium]